MSKIKQIIKNFIKTNFLFFKITPVAIIIVLLYFCFSGLYPAIYTYIYKEVFCTIERAYSTNAIGSEIWSSILIFLSLFTVKNIAEMIVDIPRSCSLYSKAKCELSMRLSSKTAVNPYIYFEDSNKYDALKRAKQCVSTNKLQRLIFSTYTVIFSVIGILGTLTILFTFNKWLSLILVVATVPYIIVVKIRGIVYYEIQVKQTKRKRLTDYLWGLFFDRNTVRELRLYGSEQYIYTKWETNSKSMYREEMAYIKHEALYVMLCQIFQILGVFLGLILSTLLIHYGKVSIGQFVAVINTFFSVQITLVDLISSFSDLMAASQYAEDYYNGPMI